MAFNRPSLQTIVSRIQSDIGSRFIGADSRLRQSLLSVMARSMAGVAHGLYGHQDWMSKQIIPDSAESEILDRHASWWNIARKSAAAGIGNVTFNGTDGAVIPAGTTLQRSDGIEYTTNVEGTIASGSVDIAITATTGGQTSNADAGQTLNLVSPIIGVQSSATVATGGFTGGADIEADSDLRERLRKRVQHTPQGGAKADYEAWALEIEGVTRVWVFDQWLGLGTVGVFITRDDDVSIIPDAAEVQAVQDHINGLRPVTADVSVIAPIKVPHAMTIQLSPNTASVQAAVQAEIEDLFRREAQVEDGNGSGTILLSHLREAISIAAGENNHVLVNPAADITLSAGELATLGVITWQAIP